MSPTRRTLLRTGLGTSTGLVGLPSVIQQSESATAAEPGTDNDPTVVKPRNPGEDVVLYERHEDGRQQAGRQLLSRREHVDRLEFADGVPADDVDAARTFLEETDYDEETILLAPFGVDSCYRYHIKSVSWDPPGNRIEYSYCKELRPPDVRCRADERDALALLFRLPAALSYEITGSGASGRSPCQSTDTDYSVIEWNASGGDR